MIAPTTFTREQRPFKRYGAVLAAWKSGRPEVLLSGPAGCIAGETRIYNPLTGEHVPVKELYEKKQAPIVQTLMGAIQAETPFRKGVAELYRVTLASGRNCLVTGNHLFLTPEGWRFARDCSPGTPLLVSVESDSRFDYGQNTLSALPSERQYVAPFQQLLSHRMPFVSTHHDGENKHHRDVLWGAYESKERPYASTHSQPAFLECSAQPTLVLCSVCADSSQESTEVLSPAPQKAYEDGPVTNAPCPHQSTWVSGLLLSPQDALRLSQTPLGSQEYCSVYPHPDGVRPLWEAGNVQSVAPSQGDALLRSRGGLCEDAQGFSREYTHHHQLSDHHARTCYSPSFAYRACILSHVEQGTSLQVDASFLCGEQFQRERDPLSPIVQSHSHVDSTRLHENLLKGYQPALRQPLHAEQATLLLQPSMGCFSSFDMTQECFDVALPLDACSLSMLPSNMLIPSDKLHCSILWDTVSSIKYERTDEYFDLHVPVAEHYLAEGIWHHNTGKSRGCLEKLHFCADKYPGCRILITRKTRESITQTAMVTFEQKVLPAGWIEDRRVHFNTTDQCYEYPNGSIIAVGGLDKASKIMSSEWDIIYVQEATELLEEDWEALTTRLRNGVIHYQQLLADCNPGAPTHWLKRRADRGDILMLESRHEDNPSVTQAYLATLDKLTGVRKLRLRYGKWAAAEGLVYDDWNRDIHLASRKQLQAWEVLTEQETINRDVIKRVLASVDWGYTNPGVIQVYGIDGDERAYLLREIYQTGKTVDDYWVPLARELKKEYGIAQFICDPAEPAYIEQFNKASLNAVKATNAIAPGINNVQARLKIAGDSRPRLYVYEYALQERDTKREAAHEPCCLEQEIDAYAWPTSKNGAPVKEVPIKVNDHAMDALRYMCQFLAEPKRGGGVLIATLTEDEEQSYRAQEPVGNGSLFNNNLYDFSSIFNGNEW